MGRRKKCSLCETLKQGFFEYEVDQGEHQLTLDLFGDGTLHVESFAGETIEFDLKIKFCPLCGKELGRNK